MLDCWQVAPQRRPTFTELSQHLSKMLSDERVGVAFAFQAPFEYNTAAMLWITNSCFFHFFHTTFVSVSIELKCNHSQLSNEIKRILLTPTLNSCIEWFKTSKWMFRNHRRTRMEKIDWKQLLARSTKLFYEKVFCIHFKLSSFI